MTQTKQTGQSQNTQVVPLPHPARRCFRLLLACAVLLASLALGIPHGQCQTVDHVIHISVDGLRPDAITALGASNLPNFYRMRTQGAFTDNARNDYDYTVTLPNHVTQLTGRGVVGTNGHNWTSNTDPPAGSTLATNKGAYVAGAFEVAHDHGLRTGEYASKSKFVLFDTSWNVTNGAPDTTPPDNGRDKIDVYVNNATTALVNTLVSNMTAQPFGYVFLHLTDPDTVGHASGWNTTPGSPYSNIIKTNDIQLGAIFNMVDTHPHLVGRTAIVLTADHGGYEKNHDTATLKENYTIPFYVWGPGVLAGADLYRLNGANRLNPGTSRPTYSAPIQPVRNGEAANVCLKLLGLGPVPGSTIGRNQDLALTIPSPADFRLALNGEDAVLTFTTRTNVIYDIQRTDDFLIGSWTNIATNLSAGGNTVTNVDAGALSSTPRFYRLSMHL